MTEYITKDSGEREQYESGMVRDTNGGKPRFDLLIAPGVPYEDQLLTRWANLMARGSEKYGDSNWSLANSEKELNRFKESAFRHFMQWMAGEQDEDHASAVLFGLLGYESTRWKLENDKG